MTSGIPAQADKRGAGRPARGWIAALKTAWNEAERDNLGIVAAGVAYYGFLAIVPMLGAFVLVYGLIADPQTVAAHARVLAGNLPQSAAELIAGQLEAATETASGTKGLGLVVALAIAQFGARKGAGAIVTALDIAYDLEERRGFVRANLVALAITAGAVAGLAIVGAVLAATGPLMGGLAKLAGYLVVFFAASGGAWLLYRYAPDRAPPPAVRQVPGAILFAVGALAGTVVFGIYVANFGSYNATYGSLGAVIVLLTWLYLTAYMLLLGAELNAPAERPSPRTQGE